jgi:hypothetical protein
MSHKIDIIGTLLIHMTDYLLTNVHNLRFYDDEIKAINFNNKD